MINKIKMKILSPSDAAAYIGLTLPSSAFDFRGRWRVMSSASLNVHIWLEKDFPFFSLFSWGNGVMSPMSKRVEKLRVLCPYMDSFTFKLRGGIADITDE